MKVRHNLRRVHIWLGWLVGVPLLIWTASGLFMAARPIEDVRGTALIADAPPVRSGLRPVVPLIGPRPVARLELEQRAEGPRWLVRYADGGARLADAATGLLLPPLTAAAAADLVRSRYTGDAAIRAVDRVDAGNPPLDFRQPKNAWRVNLDDGTRIYVARDTGEILARRTSYWRLYDFMWGLHIMDLQTREDTSHPILIVFAIVTLLSVLIALVILPWRYIRKRRVRGWGKTGTVPSNRASGTAP